MVGICKFFISVIPYVFWIDIFLFIVVALPLMIARATRGTSKVIICLLSFVMMIVAWCNAFVLTYAFWGAIGIIVGLVLVAAGLIPVGFLAALFNGSWGNLLMLSLQIAIFIGGFALASHESEKQKKQELNLKV